MKKIALIFLFFSLLFLSCKKEDPLDAIDDSGRKNPFKEYVDRFFEEAEKRDFSLSRERLDVNYMTTASEHYDSGFCGYGYSNFMGTGRARVEIHPRENCWDNRFDIEKEGLMFHELGHAVLGRFHLNNTMSNGLERSMMCGSPHNCNQFALYNQFTPKLRDYYLDELFDQSTPLPEWALPKTDTSLFYTDDFSDLGDWSFREARIATEGKFQGNYLERNGKQVLQISASDKFLEDQFAFWVKTITRPNLEEASSLKLNVKISTENLTGNGAVIILRTDSGSENLTSAFSTTQGSIIINGDQEQQAYSTTIDYVPTDINNLLIFLLMGSNSEGSVYFEDLNIEVLE